MSLIEPKYRKAVKATPQLGEFKKVRKSKLPPIQEGFDVRLESALNSKTKNCWDATEEYVKILVKFHTLAKEAPRSSATNLVPKDSSKADAELEEVQKIIYMVRDRCIHSIAYPEMYAGISPIALDELYLYWATMTEFTPDGGCEYYCLGGRGYSRFFTMNSRKTLETAGLEFEFFSLLKRFLNMFKFDSELDRQIFSLFLDGFEPVVIADAIGETELWVKKKIDSFIKMCSDHKDEFLKLSELEQQEILAEYREGMDIEMVRG